MDAMSPLVASIGNLYQEGIVDTGREAQLLFFVSFLVTFGFIRTSAHLIRAQVSWWPGNVSVGGTHIHHLVWGILLLLIFGYAGVVEQPPSPWHEILAVLFGVGTGLTLDEFALWLNLKDVYWEKRGRRSIDAVIIAGIIAGLAVTGFRAWVDAADSVANEVFAVVGLYGGLAIVLGLVNVAKEKFGIAVIGVLFWPVSLVGAFRLAKPHSLWAHHLYGEHRNARSEKRFAGVRAEPFWQRGGELVSRLRPSRAGGAG
jgi:lysyl-tRNA synthetase class 2